MPGSFFLKVEIMVYIDNSSTTRQADEVTELIYEISKNDFGNPSSLHNIGFSAEKLVEGARKAFADSIGASPDEITFNSGGTEGDNTVLFQAAKSKRHQGRRIVISEVEHPAIMESASVLQREGFEVVKAGVDRSGKVDLDELKELVTDDTILVSVMTVNNETGAIMPIREITEIAHSHGALMHTDAVQGYGKLDMSEYTSRVRGEGVDFMTVSSHKIHGPKGVGALYQKKGSELPPFIVGGGQEKNRRSGTENVPGIAGFGKACELAADLREASYDKVREVRQHLLNGIRDRIPDVIVNSPEDGIPYVLNVSFLGTRGEVILHTLEQDGIYVSTGSACSSNKKGLSYVLASLGRSSKEIEAALRFSFSRYNTVEEMDFVLDRLEKAVGNFRRLGSFR